MDAPVATPPETLHPSATPAPGTPAPATPAPGTPGDEAREKEAIRFFLPGPCYVRRHVREAMLEPVVGHRSPEFRRLYAEVAPRLGPLFRTRGEVYVATGSSTLVMESAVVSTVSEKVLNLTQGAFSERWHTISRNLGKNADRLAFPWGEAVDPDRLRLALASKRYEAVTVVHNETSTGVLNPLAEIARAVRESSDALLLVDAVSSLGGVPVEADEWGLDVVLAGVHKALAAPPGLVLFTLSERAARQARAVPHRGFYTDLLRYRASHREQGGTITTPAVPVFYAFARQLEAVAAEGLEERFRRHGVLRRMTEEWVGHRGLAWAPSPGAPSPTVSCLRPPVGITAQELVRRLAERGFTIGGGYGQWKGDTFRIGHMGEVLPEDLTGLLTALDEILETIPP